MGSPNCRIVEIQTNRRGLGGRCGVEFTWTRQERCPGKQKQRGRSLRRSAHRFRCAGPDTASTLSDRSQVVKLLNASPSDTASSTFSDRSQMVKCQVCLDLLRCGDTYASEDNLPISSNNRHADNFKGQGDINEIPFSNNTTWYTSCTPGHSNKSEKTMATRWLGEEAGMCYTWNMLCIKGCIDILIGNHQSRHLKTKKKQIVVGNDIQFRYDWPYKVTGSLPSHPSELVLWSLRAIPSSHLAIFSYVS